MSDVSDKKITYKMMLMIGGILVTKNRMSNIITLLLKHHQWDYVKLLCKPYVSSEFYTKNFTQIYLLHNDLF